MITDAMIQRINELAHKQKKEGLTAAEKNEQTALRKQYLEGIRGQVKQQLATVRYTGKEEEKK